METLRYTLLGARAFVKGSSTFTRMAVLEARADKKDSKKIMGYLPFVMFLVFGLVLGGSILNSDNPTS